MNSSLFNDRRASALLKRVRDDVHLLRADLGNLFTDTTWRTLPQGAQELADRAKHQFSSGGAYAASRFRDLGSSPRESAGWIIGAVAVGILAYGLFSLCQNNCACRKAIGDENDEDRIDA